jgi:Zn-dependent protease
MIEQLYVLPVLLFSVIIHEISHGWMALRLGDPTARDLGRLTLNPIPHIDLVGSIVVPLFSLATAGRVFIAWAKPVPVNPANFSNIRRDDILVSIVGPVSNLLIAAAFTITVAILDRLIPGTTGTGEVTTYLRNMLLVGIRLNIVLAVFNLIPIPPLDGSHVVASLLPVGIAHRFRSIGFAGVFAVILLMNWRPFAAGFEWVIAVVMSPFVSLYQLIA